MNTDPRRGPRGLVNGLAWAAIGWAAIILVGLAIAGCSTTRPEPVVRTVFVDRPVAVTCVPDTLGEAPAYADIDDALRRAPDAAARYQLVIAGREQRKARLGETEPVIKGCRK